MMAQRLGNTPPPVSLPSYSNITQVKFYGVKNASSEETRLELARAYLQGLLWTLHYYFQQEVASWRWCYNYHAAPLPSDLVRVPCSRLLCRQLSTFFSTQSVAPTHRPPFVASMCRPSYAAPIPFAPPLPPPSLSAQLRIAHECDFIAFDAAVPLLPFQQLLAVLPVGSKQLLPPQLAALMTGELADLYPEQYPCIPDPRGREWRDIAVIPQIDEARLLAAYEKAVTAQPLTDAETTRNRHTHALIFAFNGSSSTPNTSPMPDLLPSRPARSQQRPFALWPIPEGRFKPVLTKGCFTPPL